MHMFPVRIVGVSIKNFKNVVSGKLSLESVRKEYKASVLGLYGQNGSGKTALIDSLNLLKHLLTGTRIPEKYADYINVDAEKTTLSFEFALQDVDRIITFIYEFSIKSVVDNTGRNVDVGVAGEKRNKVVVFDELLKCPILSDNQSRVGKLIDTATKGLFIPVPKKVLLVGKEKDIDIDLLVAKKLCKEQSRSFAFSREFLNVIRTRVKEAADEKEKTELNYYAGLIESLVTFGNHGLFIIDTATSGLISLNAQPITFKYKEAKVGVTGTITLPLEEPAIIQEKDMELVCKVIGNMNIVLKQIIPGLTISVKDLGAITMESGEVAHRVELMSLKNSKEIPLKYESEGIKKIVSILQLLVVVYNQSSITVAVDELDAGVFEYLLGELLRIISEKGKGQLIFTSHNLRPLETIDKGFIAFTTTNPENRYIRLTNIKNNNNLRDTYYRDIMLGERGDELYEHTRNSEIALAFREAGECCGQ